MPAHENKLEVTTGMNAQAQIDAINRKAEAEHRAVDLKRDRLIQQVRDRCDHEEGERVENVLDGMVCITKKTGKCIKCGQPMPGSE